jgi:hypothetical protein
MNFLCRSLGQAIILAALCAQAFGQEVKTATARPFAGIVWTDQVRDGPPMRLHWVQADLSNPAIHLRVCPGGSASGPWETTLLPVSRIAEREKLDVAVNGSFFAPKDFKMLLGRKLFYFLGNPALACGWTVSDGRLWAEHPICVNFPSLVIGSDGRVSIGELAAPPRGASQVVSGCMMLVRDGVDVGDAGAVAPRTAVGLDKSGKRLTLLVVDGRRPTESAGMSALQLGAEMVRLGCWSSIMLDSGGSSTLVIHRGEKWPVINMPSDGHDLPIPISVERPVANALGIVVDSPGPGKMQ